MASNKIDQTEEMEDGPLPNVEVLSEVSSFCVRITEETLNPLEIIRSVLFREEELHGSEKWVLTEEKSKKDKIHYHYVVVDCKCGIDEYRNGFKSRFPQLNSGHKYNLQKSTDWKYAVGYVLKDIKDLHVAQFAGKLYFEGFTMEELEILKNFSYKKFDKGEFQKALGDLELRYMQEKRSRQLRDMGDWLDALITLKMEYNQKPNWKNSCEVIELWYLKKYRDRSIAVNYWENYIRNR